MNANTSILPMQLSPFEGHVLIGCWGSIFLCVGFFITRLLFDNFKSKIRRAVALVIVYTGSCIVIIATLASVLSLRASIGMLFGAVWGVPAGLVFAMVCLYVWDKQREKQIHASVVRDVSASEITSGTEVTR
jgi:hypothetical protein